MAQADLLVSLTSKFPKAGEMISMCPQRAIHWKGHPRHHRLAKMGNILKSVHRGYEATIQSLTQLTNEDLEHFWSDLSFGKNNSCAEAENQLRSCYCILKLAHER